LTSAAGGELSSDALQHAEELDAAVLSLLHAAA
jgi:hypothetical protein